MQNVLTSHLNHGLTLPATCESCITLAATLIQKDDALRLSVNQMAYVCLLASESEAERGRGRKREEERQGGVEGGRHGDRSVERDRVTNKQADLQIDICNGRDSQIYGVVKGGCQVSYFI